MNESLYGSDSVGLFCYDYSIQYEYEIKMRILWLNCE